MQHYDDKMEHYDVTVHQCDGMMDHLVAQQKPYATIQHCDVMIENCDITL